VHASPQKRASLSDGRCCALTIPGTTRAPQGAAPLDHLRCPSSVQPGFVRFVLCGVIWWFSGLVVCGVVWCGVMWAPWAWVAWVVVVVVVVLCVWCGV